MYILGLLLEAPHEYVQHGPLLSINWLWLCPQFGAHVRSHAVRRRLFILLMTAAHISPYVFPSETSSATYMHCFLRYIQHHSYSLYITSTRTVIPFIYMTYLHFHFLRSSWQAGCPWSFVSDTESILRKKTHIIFSPPSALFSRIFDTLRDSSMNILVFCFFVESTLNEPQGHTQNFSNLVLNLRRYSNSIVPQCVMSVRNLFSLVWYSAE
jgi:hypothetical protein